jgi:hypothetical protein
MGKVSGYFERWQASRRKRDEARAEAGYQTRDSDSPAGVAARQAQGPADLAPKRPGPGR